MPTVCSSRRPMGTHANAKLAILAMAVMATALITVLTTVAMRAFVSRIKRAILTVNVLVPSLANNAKKRANSLTSQEE